jgi:hypothetical protein
MLSTAHSMTRWRNAPHGTASRFANSIIPHLASTIESFDFTALDCRSFALDEPNRRVCCSDTEYPRMDHWPPTNSFEPSVLLSRCAALSSAPS